MHPLLHTASWGDGWISWCCSKENTAVYWRSNVCLLCGCRRVLTVPFCTRWASSPDVERALPPRLQAARSSEARSLDTAVYTCKVHQTACKIGGGGRPSSSQFRLWCPSHLFKKTSNFRLYANPARLTRRCSISPKYFTWCLISRSSSRPACESRPLTQSHSWHVHSRSAGLIAYLAAWIHWASGSGCTTPPWPRGSPSALAGCSWTESPPTDTPASSQCSDLCLAVLAGNPKLFIQWAQDKSGSPNLKNTHCFGPSPAVSIHCWKALLDYAVFRLADQLEEGGFVSINSRLLTGTFYG